MPTVVLPPVDLAALWAQVAPWLLAVVFAAAGFMLRHVWPAAAPTTPAAPAAPVLPPPPVIFPQNPLLEKLWEKVAGKLEEVLDRALEQVAGHVAAPVAPPTAPKS